MKTLVSYIQAYITKDEGATALEYGLLAALIAVVIIGAVTSLGQSTSTTFSTVATSLDAANTTTASST